MVSRLVTGMRRKTPVLLLTVALTLPLAIAGGFTAAPVNAQQKKQNRQQALPSKFKLNMMIRTTLIALNHANRTGNYTVLKDLAAPAFQLTNTAARLSEIFTKLRKRDLDLSPILFFQPKLRRAPTINDDGLLRLTGYFETKPEQISFDMLFQPVQGNWRLFGIAVKVAHPKGNAKTTSATGATDTQTEASGEKDSAYVPKIVSIPKPERRPSEVTAFATETTETPGSEEGGSTSDESSSSIWPF
jgi:hypothetical protein